MPEKSCFACKSSLQSPDQKMGTCTNPACPGGKRFYYCGYCREISFALSPDKMRCYNKSCRTFDIVRIKCDTCEKISMINHKGQNVCVNRECKSNAEIISRCYFCGNSAFLKSPHVMFCTKGNCSYLFKRVEVCGVCREQSFVMDEQVCKNASCDIAGMVVEQCPSCHLRALAEDANGQKQCLNKTCGYKSGAPSAEEDFNQTIQVPANKVTTESHDDPTTPMAPFKDIEPPSRPAPDAFRPAAVKKADPFVPMATPPPTPNKNNPPPLVRPGFGTNPQAVPTPTPGLTPRPTPPGFGPPKPPASMPAIPPTMLASNNPPPVHHPAPLAPAGGLGRALSAVEDAYAFLRNTLMSENGGQSPLYLIIGLSGSGKSTYLTMLGEILRAKGSKFSWPYDGLDARWFRVDDLLAQGRGLIAEPKRVQALKVRVKDLVYEYAQEQYGRSISKLHWPRATPRDEGDESVPSTFFLVTEIVRNQKTVARVVTLETSGEEYEDVLRNFKSFSQGEEPKNPIQRVLMDMMNQAEGFIVLIDPDSADNDAIFRDFFLVLKEELQPRALNHFYTELSTGISEAKGLNVGKADMRNILAQLASQDEKRKQYEEQVETEKRIARDRLAQIHTKLEAKQDDILQGSDGDFLRSLEEILEKQEPELVKGAREKALPPGSRSTSERREMVIKYYKGLTRVITDRLDRVIRDYMAKNKPKPEAGASLWDIKRKYDLSDNFKIEIEERSFAERPVRKFKNLNHVSLVVTKTDKYAIVYPPENYPRKKLPGCEMHLRDIEDFLKLLNGQVRYYNASATGYAILDSGSHIPGRENTHTPINILEPLFDMLNITN